MSSIAPGSSRVHSGYSMDALGTLAGGIAHEMNNMLTVLQGYLELINASISDGNFHEVSQHSVEMGSALSRLAGVVRQMMSFSRRPPCEPEPVQVGPLINGGVTLLRAAMPPRIAVTFEQTGVDAAVVADPTRLRLAVLNLGVAGFRAMEHAGGTLRIRVGPIEGGSPAVAISFSTFGPDENPADRVQQYLPYDDERRTAGDDLRLSLVSDLASEMGGFLEVDHPGTSGGAARIVLPADHVTAPREIPTAHVLFVDDEEPLTQLGTMSLERLGYRVTGCGNGRTALDLFCGNPHQFDIIVTDQVLPELLGHELAAEVRAVRPDMPVVIVTGTSDDYTRDHAAEEGYRYLAKPYTLDQLRSAVTGSLPE